MESTQAWIWQEPRWPDFSFDGAILSPFLARARKYVGMTKTSRATAYRELADLVDNRCLVATEGGGRSSGYRLVR